MEKNNVDSTATYNILPVCVGYGGLDIGLKLAIRNLRTVAYVEREAQACAGLAARMQDGTLDEAPIWSDLSTFDGRPFRGLVDCVVSSDPCQPNSVAGSRRGSEDDRFLIDQLVRVIDEVRPARVFRENVTGNADGQLAALVPALEQLGYSVAAGIFSAEEVGASHRRERLFIMADAKSDPSARLREREEQEQEQSKSRLGGGDLANPISAGAGVGEHRSSGQGRKPARALEPEILRQTDRQASSERINATDTQLANPESQQRTMGEAEGREPQRHASGGSGELADALRGDVQGQQSGQHYPSGWQVKDGQAGLCDRTRIFAPGPNDPAWPDIIARTPLFAPSISQMDVAKAAYVQAAQSVGEDNREEAAQSYFRGATARLAHRVDRLRAGGNGVCSMAGAIAWLSLSAHFEQQ